MKIRYKLTLGFMLIVFFVGITGLVALYFQNQIVDNFAIKEKKRIEIEYQNLINRDIKMLSSSLEVFAQDQTFKDIFLKKDRDALYAASAPLFKELKNKYGITHFYYILPDGTCFLRVHDKEKFNDTINRFTFLKARDKEKVSSGLELGKTAFALRVVRPYYDNGNLIGYVEFGEEIEHLFQLLKSNTNNEFAIFIDKKFLDRNDWKQVRQTDNLKDSWDDLKEHILIHNTAKKEDEQIASFFTEDNMIKIENKETFHKRNQYKNKTFTYGGFEIFDAGDRNAGIILSIIDITEQVNIVTKSNFSLFTITTFLCVLALGISIYTSRLLSVPILKLKEAVSEIGKGNMNLKVDINTKDEIGYLADSINKMSLDLKASRIQVIQSEKMSAVGTLSAGVAHELNNPMMGIMNFIQYCIKHTTIDDKRYEVLKDAERETKRCAAIIKNLLTFSRMENEGDESRIKQSCAIIFDRVFKLLTYRIEKEHIDIIKNFAEGTPDVWIKENNIQQVFFNLTTNSMDALAESNKKQIQIDIKQKNGFVQIIFADTGSGISPDKIDKIFEPFFTTKPTGQGTGLGLSVVQNIINEHKGTINCISKLGEGTRFEILLPIDIRQQ